jgi:[ribosomal protein S5]-alanine N-acetyltransferase
VRLEPPETLTDGTLVLRALRPADAPGYAGAFSADPDLGRLLGVERDPDEASIRSRIEGQLETAERGAAVEFAIADASSDALWGSVIMHSFDWHHRRCELGFWLVPAARGRGVGSGAVALAVSWAMSNLSLLRVEMTTTPDNAPVFALARRLGFVQEGVLRRRNVERGQRVDVVWFGLLREEWREN